MIFYEFIDELFRVVNYAALHELLETEEAIVKLYAQQNPPTGLTSLRGEDRIFYGSYNKSESVHLTVSSVFYNPTFNRSWK